jgi:hypothetical protein
MWTAFPLMMILKQEKIGVRSCDQANLTQTGGECFIARPDTNLFDMGKAGPRFPCLFDKLPQKN